MSEMSWSPVRGAVAVFFFGSVAVLSFACGGDKEGTAKPEAASSAKPASSTAAASSAAAAAKPGKAGKPKTAKKGAAKPAKGSAPDDEGEEEGEEGDGDGDEEEAKPGAPVTTPEQQSYPMGNIKTIPDNCSNAHAIVATAPESVGEDYAWPYTKQAMLANQQFKTVSSASAPGQVSFEIYNTNGAYALVATCGDGSTCNRLAAMYKAVVKTSNPQVMCGPVPPHMGSPVKSVSLISGDPASNVPQSGDTIGACARIAACTIATKPDTADDVGIQCQKGPSNFKTQCASKYPCAEVMACTGQ